MDIKQISKLKKQTESEINKFISEKLIDFQKQSGMDIDFHIKIEEVIECGSKNVYAYVVQTTINPLFRD